MEGIGAAAQDYRSVPQMPRCPSWWPEDQRNGEPCALKGASTVRGEALGVLERGASRPPYRDAGTVARSAYARAPIEPCPAGSRPPWFGSMRQRSEEHTSELQSLMRISYAVF